MGKKKKKLNLIYIRNLRMSIAEAQQVITAYQNGELTMFACIGAMSYCGRVTFEKCQEKRKQLVENFVDEHNEEFADILETGYNWVPKTLSKCNEDCFKSIEDVIYYLCNERRLGFTDQKTAIKYFERRKEFEDWVATTDYKEKLAVINAEYDEEEKQFVELFSEIEDDPFFDEACERLENLEEEISNQAKRLFQENNGMSIEEAFEQATNSCLATKGVDVPEIRETIQNNLGVTKALKTLSNSFDQAFGNLLV